MNIKKYVSVYGTTLEIGDFYGGGDDEVITVMQDTSSALRVFTNHGYWDLTIKPGDYLVFVDGSSKIVKIKAEEAQLTEAQELAGAELDDSEELDYKESMRDQAKDKEVSDE